MGRPKSVAGGRPYVIHFRLSNAEKQHLDALRGGLSISDYIRSLLTEHGTTPPSGPTRPTESGPTR